MFNTQGNALQDALNSLRSIVKLVIGIVITLVAFTKSDIMIPHIVARSVVNGSGRRLPPEQVLPKGSGYPI